MEKALGAKVQTKYIENVPEGADAERVIRELAASGHKLIFTTSFGYMNPTEQGREAVPDRHVRARHRLQDGEEPRHLQRALLRRPLPRRHRRRQDVRRRTSPATSPRSRFPKSSMGINAFTQRHAQRQPEGRSEGDLGELVVRPGQEREAANTLHLAGRRRVTHHTDSTAVVQAAEAKRASTRSAITPTCRSTARTRTSRRPRTTGATFYTKAAQSK